MDDRPGNDGSRASGDGRVMLWLGIVMAAALLLVSSGSITGSDGPASYEVSRSIVEDLDLTVPAPLGFRGTDGGFYASHGLGLPLLGSVVYAAGRPVASLTPHPDLVTRAIAASLMPIVAALLAVAMFALARTLGSDRRSALLVAVGAVVATFLFPYTKDYYSEPLATLFVVVGIQQTLARKPLGAGSALAAAGITRPQTFVLLPVAIWFAWREQGVRAAAAIGCLGCAGIALEAWYNYARFGDVFQADPLQGGFRVGGGLLEGSVGLLASPEKSLLLFAPVALLVPFGLASLWSRSRAAFWLLSWNLVATFLIAAAWPAWDGGFVWGPRLLLPGLIPALASVAPWVGAGQRQRRFVVTGLLAAGVLVNLPAVLVSTRAQLRDPVSVHGPSVLRQVELVGPAFAATVTHFLEPDTPDRSLDFWQVRAARRGEGPGVALAVVVSGALVGLALWALRRCRKLGVRSDRKGARHGVVV